jgi:hypothetical protein
MSDRRSRAVDQDPPKDRAVTSGTALLARSLRLQASRVWLRAMMRYSVTRPLIWFALAVLCCISSWRMR